MPTSLPDARVRRPRLRSSTSFDMRRSSRRLFGRGSSNAFASSLSMPPDEEDTRRRSFLAKPPAPGAARRVLAVLNQSQKRSSPFASRRAPAARAPPQPSVYDNNPDRREHADPEENHWHPLPPSPLKKPLAPPRHVRPLDDLPDAVRSDSVGSSMPSSRGSPSSRGGPSTGLLEVEASEVSDDINSSTDPKSRSGRFSGSSGRTPEREPVMDARELIFIDDVATPGVEFGAVGDEEEDVPEAPTDSSTQFSNKVNVVQTWAALEERIRTLQLEADTLREAKLAAERANADLELRSKELQVLVESFRTRSAESSAEVEELTRHLKDTRRRLTRRIRELEDELVVQKEQHGQELAAHRAAEHQLRADLEILQSGKNFARTESVPSMPTRRKRTATPVPVAATHADVSTRPLASDSIMSHPSQNLHFARVRSAGNVHEQVRRRPVRGELLSAAPRPATPNHKSASPHTETSTCSPRTLARRSLIRRAFIAHVHSGRYRSAKSAWYEFLGADAGNVTPEQFARAVRGLAVAADARDRDLEVLRQEVCGAEECDTGVVTWAMFVRFYQSTKNEST